MGKRHRKKKTYVPYVSSRALGRERVIVPYTHGLKARLGEDLLRVRTETPFLLAATEPLILLKRWDDWEQ